MDNGSILEQVWVPMWFKRISSRSAFHDYSAVVNSSVDHAAYVAALFSDEGWGSVSQPLSLAFSLTLAENLLRLVSRHCPGGVRAFVRQCLEEEDCELAADDAWISSIGEELSQGAAASFECLNQNPDELGRRFAHGSVMAALSIGTNLIVWNLGGLWTIYVRSNGEAIEVLPNVVTIARGDGSTFTMTPDVFSPRKPVPFPATVIRQMAPGDWIATGNQEFYGHVRNHTASQRPFMAEAIAAILELEKQKIAGPMGRGEIIQCVEPSRC